MITMDKRYKYKSGEEAKILCIDRPCNGNLVVLSMRPNGATVSSTIDGRSSCYRGEFDLVEYIEPVYEYRFAITTSVDTAILRWMTMLEAVELSERGNSRPYKLPDDKRERK